MKSNQQISDYLKLTSKVTTETNKDFILGWEDALNYVFYNQEEEEEIKQYLKSNEFNKKEPLTHYNGWIMAYKWLLKD